MVIIISVNSLCLLAIYLLNHSMDFNETCGNSKILLESALFKTAPQLIVADYHLHHIPRVQHIEQYFCLKLGP